MCDLRSSGNKKKINKDDKVSFSEGSSNRENLLWIDLFLDVLPWRLERQDQI